jgi:hypothetical protein
MTSSQAVPPGVPAVKDWARRGLEFREDHHETLSLGMESFLMLLQPLSFASECLGLF